jgi:hypothetical protein
MDRAEIQDEIEQLKGLVNRNADLSKANIRLLEENTEFRKSIDLLQDQIADLLHAIRNVSAASLKN